ncbi:M24 family metallopeptidase [Natrialbaceae archaeon A-CW2]
MINVMLDVPVIEEKLEQAVDELSTQDVDLWITYCRETTEIDEPCLPFLLGFDVVWPTLILVSKEGRAAVIIGSHDAANAESLGLYEVCPYDESPRDHLLELVNDIDPGEIAVNYSEDFKIADGLTHGMYRKLTGYLEGSGYENRLQSSASVVCPMRSRKSDTERDRIFKAGTITEELYTEVTEQWDPEWTEQDVARYLHNGVNERELETAWSWDYCPLVDAGGEAAVGHTIPGDRRVPPGEVLHLDFGVKYKGYAADLQRLYYYPEDGEDPPAGLQDVFDSVRGAIEAAFDVLEPGVKGYEVDQVAREYITEQGYPEYRHGLGHNVGRNAHDDGTLLGPRWEHYGQRPYGTVQSGEIYTLELGVDTEWGYIGQEDMVKVTSSGAEYFIPPQDSFRILEP